MIQLVRVTVENFKALRGPHTVPLMRQGVLQVTGENLVSRSADSNGASKTALMISAPCWCLFGRTENARERPYSLPNRFAKKAMAVTLELDDEGERYVLQRRLEGRAEKLTLTGPHSTLHDPKVKLRELITFDLNYFTNVVALNPNFNARFSEATDTERKAIFDHIVPDLGALAALYEDVDGDVKYVEGQLEVLEQERESVTAQIDGLVLSSKAFAEAEARRREERFHDWLELLSRERELEAERLALYERACQNLLLLERAERARGRGEELERLIQEMRRHVDAANKAAGKVEQLQAELRRSMERLAELVGSGTCPTCRRAIGRKDVDAISRKFDEEQGVVRREIDAGLLEIGQGRRVARTLPELEAEAREVLALLAAAEQVDGPEAVAQKLRDLERRLLEVDRHVYDPLRPRPRLREPSMTERVDELYGKLRACEVREKELSRAKAGLEFWHRGLSNRGIKSRLLDGVEDFLDSRLRHYSQALTAGELVIGFSSRTQLKSKEYRDAISVSAEHIFGSPVLEGHSSGERQRIDLALILALQDVSRAQQAARAKTLLYSAFDEVLDHLDETGCERMLELLISEREVRGTTVLISQNPRLLSYPANHRVVVRRTRNKTEVIYDEKSV